VLNSYLNCEYVSLANGMDPDLSLFYHQPLYLKIREEVRQVAAQYPSLQVSLPPTVEEEKHYIDSPHDCLSPWNFAMVDTNGQILPCYRAFEALRFKSLYDKQNTFSEIWNSPGYRKLRDTVNKPNCTKHYSYCSICEFRFGLSGEQAHLCDAVWKKVVNSEDADHRRPGSGLPLR
jgi:radical SAM protein with 4Fe4S-binding SPASM domain